MTCAILLRESLNQKVSQYVIKQNDAERHGHDRFGRCLTHFYRTPLDIVAKEATDGGDNEGKNKGFCQTVDHIEGVKIVKVDSQIQLGIHETQEIASIIPPHEA